MFQLVGEVTLRGADAVQRGLQRIDRGAQSTANKMGRFGSRAREVGGTLTTRLTAPIGSLGTAAVMAGANFDTSMSRVQAVTGATGKELGSLRDMAKDMGAKTKFSASEAADAMGFLGMAGFDTNQIMKSIPNVLDLAAAGAIDLGRAADISSNILTGFGLEAEDMGRVSNVMAKTAASANTNIEQLGNAMSYVAPIASSAGWSIEETSAAIGIMSDAGIQGEKAGTALRGVISSLIDPVGSTSDALKELGLSAEDVNPQTKSLSEILKTLEQAGMDTKTAMQLVGVEAGPGLLAMMKEGSAGLNEFTGDLNNADGAAGKMAKTMSDNTAGGFKELMSAVEGVAISFYESMRPAIQKVTEWLTALTRKLNGMSDESKTVMLVIAGIVAAIGPMIMVIGMLAGAIGNIIAVMPKLVTAFKAVTNAMRIMRLAFLTNPFTLIVTAVVLAATLIIMNWDKIKGYLIAAWNYIKAAASKVWNAIKSGISTAWNAIKNITTSVWNGIKSFFKTVWNTYVTIVKTYIKVVKTVITSVWNAVKSVTTSVWNGIKSAISGAWNSIKSLVRSAMSGIRSTMTSIWNSIKSAVSGAWNGIKSIISDGISRAWSTIKGFAGKFLSAGKGLLDALAKGIRKGISKAVDAVKSGMSRVRSFLPFSPAKEGPLSDLDKSGASLFPTMASEMSPDPLLDSVGNALTQARQKLNQGLPGVNIGGSDQAAGLLGSGGQPVVITGNTFNVRDEQDIERVARQLYQMQRERQRGPGGRNR